MGLVKYNNNSISAITTAGQLASGGMVLIKEQTASSSSTISFVDGSGGVVLDSTYPIYKFEFINIHPSADDKNFQFNMSSDSGSNYNVTKTTTVFKANHDEGDSATNLTYDTGEDLAQGTGFQNLANGVGGDNDQSLSGTLHLFNPSNTTFVKHFISTIQYYAFNNYTNNWYVAGYGNTSSAVDAVQFKFNSGNIDSGTIKLYGIKDS
jgi:hypothetical protein